MKIFITLFITLIFAASSLPNAVQPVIAHPQSLQSLVPTIPGQASSFQVVRAYYTDRRLVNELAQYLEPWEVHHDQGYLVIGVTPSEYELLQSLGFRLEVDQALTNQANQPRLSLPQQISGIPSYPCYRTVEETYATAQAIVAAHPTLAAWIDIGDSWDKQTDGGSSGYDLMVLRLTNSAIPGPKPKLFIMSAVHAREYATAELSTRFAEHLINQYNINADITWLLDYHEIHLLLQSNPDGRKQAETGLLWRKNTNQNYCSSNPGSRGADLNRNFSFKWACCGGSSGNQCSETYRGSSPASEPETQAIQNYVLAQFPDQRGPEPTDPAPDDATGVFIDLHSYSQLVLWPWGYTSEHAPNNTALQTLGRKFAYFNSYEPEQAVGLYPTDGSTDDFAYGETGIAAYTFEVGTSFFENCNHFQNTVYPDNLPALIYAAKAARAPYQIPSGPDTLNLPSTLQAYRGGSVILTATINDSHYSSASAEPTQNVAAAAYYVDTPPWLPSAVAHPMGANDGDFNTKNENVIALVETTGLSYGRHTIFVRGQDADGNWGAVSAIFLDILSPYGLSRSPESSVLGGEAGQNINHTVRFTNTGILSDTYTIVITSTWPVSLTTPLGPLTSGDNLVLNAGQSMPISIAVPLASDGQPGDSSTIALSITSQNEPLFSQQTQLISFIHLRIFLANIFRLFTR